MTHPGIYLAGDVPVAAGAEENDRLGELLDADDARELVTKLEEYLTEAQAVKVVDLMPEDLDDLRLIFAKERGNFDTDLLQNILDLLDQYR